ncbi:alpha/beta fold hydrolase [Corynebacterium sp.]|uniref:alpha/beta fold hydrolase n=1 Tax=Corynebacterium sp. TaxID=1720 RepID=UPI0025C0FB28|nr:alpha/beta fold hydrolase [Corynebacterium sp.]
MVEGPGDRRGAGSRWGTRSRGRRQFSRKTLLLLDGTVMGLSILLPAVINSLWSDADPMMIVGFLCIYVAFYTFTWAPLTWVIVGEIFPLLIRGRPGGLRSLLRRVVSPVVCPAPPPLFRRLVAMTILHSRITGHEGPDARSVVLLGALGSSVDMWTPLQDAVSGIPDGESFRLIALDHRGHGASPLPDALPGRSETVDDEDAGGRPAVPAGPTTIADLASDVCDTLDTLGTGAVDLVGLSIGGAVAQHIAAHAPQRVRTLTLMCTAPSFGAPEDWETKALAVRSRGIITLRELSVGTVPRWLTGDFRRTRPGTALAVQEMITRTSIEGYAGACDALSTFNGQELLGQITAPTLTLAGEQDPTCPPATLAQMNEVIPTAVRHLVLPGAHLLPVELPGQVGDALREHWTAY